VSLGRSLASIAGSNPAVGSHVCRLYVVRWRSLGRPNLSTRKFLLNVICLSVNLKPQKWGDLGPIGLSSHGRKIV